MKPLLAILFLVSLSMIGCDSLQVKPSDSAIRNMAVDLTYFRDARTLECFAAVGQRTDSIHPSIQVTWVPCSTGVMAVIGADNSSLGTATTKAR